MNQSIATIKSPEFINLTPLDINPLMSKCEIKVLYTGKNRNGSFISKEVAEEMAKTLRGAPIVGYYVEDKEDFLDHGEQMVFDGEGIKFNCLTKPYGFVAPDAAVWFQEFEDTDGFGNTITREYLMTTGYLWTGQFEECKRAVEKGNNQSMELDNDSLDGKWENDPESGWDFFIINDAIFSKLCILGEDVEPCFEGANITAPEVSKTFSKVDNGFKNTLFSMMKDLKSVLEKGGKYMLEEENKIVDEVPAIEEEKVEEFNPAEVVENENAEIVNSFEQEEKTEDSVVATEEKEEVANVEETVVAPEFSLEDYKKLEKEVEELRAFKLAVERKEKEGLIEKFYMLSEEDKKDVKENIDNYSYDDIEAKLSVICVRKKVNFEQEDNEKNEVTIEEEKEAPVTTFNLSNEEVAVPAWISALIETKNSRK